MIGISGLRSILGIVSGTSGVVYIRGKPGVGKSSIVKLVGKELGYEVTDIRLSQMLPEDIVGVPVVSGSRFSYVVSSLFPLEGDVGCKRLLFLDEFSSCDRLVQSASYRLVLDREVGSYRLRGDTWIVCAGNGIDDLAIVNEMSSALVNRLIVIDFEPGLEEWVGELGGKLDGRIVSYLRGHINHFIGEVSVESFASPRSWYSLSGYMHLYGSEIFEELVYGHIGRGIGSVFIDWLDSSFKLNYVEMRGCKDLSSYNLGSMKMKEVMTFKDSLIGYLDSVRYSDVSVKEADEVMSNFSRDVCLWLCKEVKLGYLEARGVSVMSSDLLIRSSRKCLVG